MKVRIICTLLTVCMACIPVACGKKEYRRMGAVMRFMRMISCQKREIPVSLLRMQQKTASCLCQEKVLPSSFPCRRILWRR